MNTKRRAACLLMALLMMLLFNFPVLSAVNRFAFSGSFPDMFLYLFTGWAFCIICLAWIVLFRKSSSKRP